ncbi:MAG TPA: bifunctional hydroxymethylpyrimidine kinase/phosphomethylpyrimidine kinase [Verrucomicrobiae bacterium]|nr:bifunctional hydroxymethylpyrimidine kinase/phosphomethylpyrimidine kinase [Verrucomicrobiae bacterium]
MALTIAGSDSGGGAGIQADLKTFAALGVHGTCAITSLTAQNPRGVAAVQMTRPALVREQITAVFAELPPRAVKTGLLGSAAVIREVAMWFRKGQPPPLVVDPVMISTSGHKLLPSTAARALCQELLPLAALVTPNLDEAGWLLGKPLATVEDLRAAARAIHERFGCAVLMKGGHLQGLAEAVDIFWDGRVELLLSAPFVRGVKTHGTGCTYSAAITAQLALGRPLPEAVAKAKEYVTRAIATSVRAGRHDVLNWLSQG